MSLLMGAVAYDAKVVSIWSGFRTWLVRHGLPFDFVLYSHYERQVEDLTAGRLHCAWHSPLAWLRSQRLAAVHGVRLRPLAMRDTDQDLTSVVVVRADSSYARVQDLKDATVAVGAQDSPQATLIPLESMRRCGLRPHQDFTVRRHDTGVGLHGDHIGGERDAARALVAGQVAAACMTDANHLLFCQEGTLPPGSTRVLAETAPYDHCVLAVGESADGNLADLLGELLLSMSYSDPEVRHLLEMEGLTAWRPGRDTGYDLLAAAVDDAGFYDERGAVTAHAYRP